MFLLVVEVPASVVLSVVVTGVVGMLVSAVGVVKELAGGVVDEAVDDSC